MTFTNLEIWLIIIVGLIVTLWGFSYMHFKYVKCKKPKKELDVKTITQSLSTMNFDTLEYIQNKISKLQVDYTIDQLRLIVHQDYSYDLVLEFYDINNNQYMSSCELFADIPKLYIGINISGSYIDGVHLDATLKIWQNRVLTSKLWLWVLLVDKYVEGVRIYIDHHDDLVIKANRKYFRYSGVCVEFDHRWEELDLNNVKGFMDPCIPGVRLSLKIERILDTE